MDNMEFEVSPDDILTIRVDLKEELGPNKHGTIMIASSRGNALIWKDGKPHPRKLKLNMSVFRSHSPNEKRTNRWQPPGNTT